MSGLRELQSALGRAVLGQDEPSLSDAIDSDGIDAGGPSPDLSPSLRVLADRGLEGDLSRGLPAGG